LGSGEAGKILNEISHPDEIEKKKHFIGQAETHGRTQTGFEGEIWNVEGGKRRFTEKK
jgi:hypothetical protein